MLLPCTAMLLPCYSLGDSMAITWQQHGNKMAITTQHHPLPPPPLHSIEHGKHHQRHQRQTQQKLNRQMPCLLARSDGKASTTDSHTVMACSHPCGSAGVCCSTARLRQLHCRRNDCSRYIGRASPAASPTDAAPRRPCDAAGVIQEIIILWLYIYPATHTYIYICS